MPNPRDAKSFGHRGRPARPRTAAERRLQWVLTGFCIACLIVIGTMLHLLYPWAEPDGTAAPVTQVVQAFRDPALDLQRPFRNCDAAHAAGFYSIPTASPAYSPFQDKDRDGFACEPLSGGGPADGAARVVGKWIDR